MPADLELELLEGRRQERGGAGAVLLSSRQPGLVRIAGQVNDDRLFRRRHALVAADGRSGIEARAGVLHARRVDVRHAERCKRRPPPDEDVVVHHRHFDAVRERFLLLLGQLRHQRGNQRVVAREDHVGRADAVHLAVAQVCDANGLRALGGSVVLNAYHGAAQPDPYGRRCLVQLRVVRLRLDDRVHRQCPAGRERIRHEPVDQQPRERRVAIRKMERVRALLKFRSAQVETQPVETD